MLNIAKHKELFYFISLNYIDKGIFFILPLSILYITNNLSIYNNLEYIFSVASIAVILIELGGRFYVLYGYRNEEINRDLYLKQIKGFYHFLNFFYSILVLFIFIIVQIIPNLTILLYFISIRILFLMFINFFSIYYRLEDRPEKILYYSISINVLTILTLVIFQKFTIDTDKGLYYFFLIQVIFLILLCIKGVKYINKQIFEFTISYLKKSIKYSWPIIINLVLATLVSNLSKIYVFAKFDKEEMFTFSYFLRISMIIQLAHASIVSFYSKKIYLNSKEKIDFHIYKLYNLFILLAIGLCFFVILIINNFNLVPKVKLNVLFIVLISYVFFWCQQAYFEQYLNRKNKNIYVLYASLMGVFIYLLMLFINPFHLKLNINYISCCMLISVLISFLGVMFYIKKYKII